MGARVLGLGLMVLASVSASRPAAAALTCAHYESLYGTVPPECMSEESTVVHYRLASVCPANDPDLGGLEVVYPDPATLGVGEKFTPVVLLHGGGVAPGYKDIHAPGQSHWTDAYQDMARRLVLGAGVVVFQPILPNLQSKASVSSAGDIQYAISCVAARVADGCTTGCIPDLVGHVDWGPNNYSKTIYIGHSAGGIAGLWVPEMLQSALRGMILIDPARDGIMDTPSDMYMSSPLVHIYPDWQGPLKESQNELLSLGQSAFVTGPWVPIGLRDYGCSAGGCNPVTTPCDPDAGCHTAHHCTGLGDNEAWNVGVAGHPAYCADNVASCGTDQDNKCSTDPGCVAPFPSQGYCPSGTTCGQYTKCTRNGAVNPDYLSWTFGTGGGANSSTIMQRYVVAYAGCMGGVAGGEMQSWVNGKHRSFDDAGTGSQCTKDGFTDATCGAYSTAATCNANANCLWAQAMDGKVIRINNGQAVTEYNHHIRRWYTAAQGYQATGTCQSGPNAGQACTTDAFCGSGYNCTAGDFVERVEKLSTSAFGGTYPIACQ